MSEPVIRPPTLSRVSGAHDANEAAQAMVAGLSAPDVLHFDPRHPKYDPYWCERLRVVSVNMVSLTDVVGFDLPRGEVEVMLRDANGKEIHTYDGPKWYGREWPTGRLRYKTAIRTPGDGHAPALPARCPCGCGRTMHAAVEYGVLVQRGGADRRGAAERRQS